MKHTQKGITLELIQGDITAQNGITAVVNAANAELRVGGGVAGAIHRAAGPSLEEECRPHAPIRPGEAIITSAHKLPNEYVIHCLGPVYGVDKPEDKLLANCYQNALKIADENGVESIAFPALSTGAFGYPMKPAAEVAFQAILEMLPTLKKVKTIRFVLFSESDLEIHSQVLKNLVEK